jgi:hypothetical protein
MNPKLVFKNLYTFKSPWEISCHQTKKFGCHIMVLKWQWKKGHDPLTTTKIITNHLMVIELRQHHQIAIDFGCHNLMVTKRVSITIV